MFSRLKKIANLETFENQQMEMPQNVINQVLDREGQEYTVSHPVYRKMIHKNNKYIVEMWDLGDDKVAIVSGTFKGNQWTLTDIEFHGIFDNLQLAIQHAMQAFQSETDTPGAITANKKNKLKKTFRKH